MQANNQLPGRGTEDQDIHFDMNEQSTTASAPRPEETGSDYQKLEEISKEEIIPLSEEEKQPKLQDYEKIREMQEEERLKEKFRKTTV